MNREHQRLLEKKEKEDALRQLNKSSNIQLLNETERKKLHELEQILTQLDTVQLRTIWSKKLLLFSDFFEFMRCFSSVFVRHFTPSIPYAIPPTAPPIIPPTISLYIRPSVPLSVSPITCIERSKQGVTFNRELFALIGGVFVFCSFALGNHWSLKNQIGSEKERQESISKEILAKLKEQKEVNEVNEAIEVVNEINEVNEDK
ncbi:unnamed protein product [Rhizophagus irregularis]|nr:unnamed protein product [Rhizophagus irregularis]CAB5201932.1 unnamed protein product [Rhizophagus irregularis]